MNTLNTILEGLMSRYKQRVPDVSKIIKALFDREIIEDETRIENDHIAFRTMGVPHLGIGSLEKLFLHYGYTTQDAYDFELKKLNARWYAPPQDHLPRIFISELRVTDFSSDIQGLIRSYTDQVNQDPVANINLDNAAQVDQYLHSALWQTPTWVDYKKLREVSEYAAWVIYNRYYLNHYTISVHELPEGYNTLKKFNLFLEDIGVLLSDAGGIIKTSPDGLLLQSATVSQMTAATFAEGETHQIPGSYVEFAQRKVRPEFSDIPLQHLKREHRREGFEAANADKIFESTFTSQTKRNQ